MVCSTHTYIHTTSAIGKEVMNGKQKQNGEKPFYPQFSSLQALSIADILIDSVTQLIYIMYIPAQPFYFGNVRRQQQIGIRSSAGVLRQ